MGSVPGLLCLKTPRNDHGLLPQVYLLVILGGLKFHQLYLAVGIYVILFYF